MTDTDLYDPRTVGQIECDRYRALETHRLGHCEDGIEHEYNTLERLNSIEAELEAAQGKPARLVVEGE